jgi:hypothetical protein
MSELFDPVVLLPPEPRNDNVIYTATINGHLVRSVPATEGLTASQVMMMAGRQAKLEYEGGEACDGSIYVFCASLLMEQAAHQREHGDSLCYELMRGSIVCENDCAGACEYLSTQIIRVLVLSKRREAKQALKLLGVRIRRAA